MRNMIDREDLGICPVCGKGHILKTPLGYYCDNRIAEDGLRRCKFHLPVRYKGVTITDEIIHELMAEGHTDYMRMQSMKGLPYTARLAVRKDEGVIVETERKIMDVRCPKCGDEMVVTRSGYSCAGRLQEKPSCDFFIPNYLCRRFIEEDIAEDFINGTPDILDGFIGKNGKYFSGYLSEKDGVRVIESSIGKCPVCGGNMYVGVTAFNCSNYSADGNGCNFMFYRHIHGHLITLKEAMDICRYGHTTEPFESYDQEGHIIYVNLVVNVDKCRVEIVKSMGKPKNSNHSTN